MERFYVRQCTKCGQVVEVIRTGKTKVLVEGPETELFPKKGGSVVGYKLSGQRVEGERLLPGERSSGTCYVHLLHNCGHSSTGGGR